MCLCVKKRGGRAKKKKKKSRAVARQGTGIDCSCRKMFLIYLGHRGRIGPSVSPHDRKIQSQKNNIPNLSSAQLQMGGGVEERVRGKDREEREGKMEIGWRWRGERRGESRRG